MMTSKPGAGVLENAATTDRAARPAPGQAMGLCGSCTRAEDCTFIRRAEQAVLDCDEFAPVEPRRTAPHLVLAPPAFAGLAEHDEEEAAAIGLCRSCAHRADCVYPRPQGGVWHCDDYR